MTTVSGFKMILEDAGRDANGHQLWRQIKVGLGQLNNGSAYSDETIDLLLYDPEKYFELRKQE